MKIFVSCLSSNISLIVEGGPPADLVNVYKCPVPDLFSICCFNRRGSAKVMKCMLLYIFQ